MLLIVVVMVTVVMVIMVFSTAGRIPRLLKL